MPFAYYRSLSRKDKAIYDASDRVSSIALSRAEALPPIVDILRQVLERDDRALVEAAAARLVLGIAELLEVEPVDVKVLAVRPELRSAELHGLYTRDDARRPRIRVWMRTLRSHPCARGARSAPDHVRTCEAAEIYAVSREIAPFRNGSAERKHPSRDGGPLY